jgi:hypothetical protein
MTEICADRRSMIPLPRPVQSVTSFGYPIDGVHVSPTNPRARNESTRPTRQEKPTGLISFANGQYDLASASNESLYLSIHSGSSDALYRCRSTQILTVVLLTSKRPFRNWLSGVQLIEQRLRLLQIARVEPLGEPAVNRSEQFACLLQPALVAPEAGEAHCGM